MGFQEEGEAERAHARETERALERERERTREKGTLGAIGFCNEGAASDPGRVQSGKRGKTKAAAGKGLMNGMRRVETEARAATAWGEEGVVGAAKPGRF